MNFHYGLTNEKIQSQVTIITIDDEYVLAIGSKDISNNGDEINENALAIYSNSKYTVMIYGTILEALWTKTDKRIIYIKIKLRI